MLLKEALVSDERVGPSILNLCLVPFFTSVYFLIERNMNYGSFTVECSIID